MSKMLFLRLPSKAIRDFVLASTSVDRVSISPSLGGIRFGTILLKLLYATWTLWLMGVFGIAPGTMMMSESSDCF